MRALPHPLALDRLVNVIGLKVRAVNAVHSSNGVSQAGDLRRSHAAISTSFLTVMGLLAIPASIAGVQRIVLREVGEAWRRWRDEYGEAAVAGDTTPARRTSADPRPVW